MSYNIDRFYSLPDIQDIILLLLLLLLKKKI